MENQELQKRKIEIHLQQQKKEIEEYKQKLQDSQSAVVELHKKLDDITKIQMATENEMKEMQGMYKNYCSNILNQYSGSLRTLSTEFSKILENIATLQQNIVELDSIENFDLPMDELEEKNPVDLPELGIDIDEWLHGEEKEQE